MAGAGAGHLLPGRPAAGRLHRHHRGGRQVHRGDPYEPLSRTTPKAAPDAVRLFCFPHAGGSASFFAPWREPLLPDIDVCPVLLPGRESRSAEPPPTEARDVIEELAGELARREDLAERPYAFFGHSLGAAIAYDVACALEAAGRPGPGALIVSGRRSPYAPRRVVRSHTLDDDAFVASLVRLGGVPAEFLGRGETYKFFLPLLRADFALDESYRPGFAPPGVRCPVLAVTGADDPLATPGDLAGWRETTRGEFSARSFPGGHFYLRAAADELRTAAPDGLLATIRALLSPTPPPAARPDDARPAAPQGP
ncbi:thioesterase II family protein [Streptomyces sp. KN37]|uniref:thioesterase II family protein n=1 Tax=Streptomyces sp. KN37 TaxID=3090667 RepID=UPI002A749C45|nr:thioesterase domain-containing protein [Streptomyces sp. KN37]WPO75872.1 thioesterase domain-containing protein [Streptomyces sp. KN37]